MLLKIWFSTSIQV